MSGGLTLERRQGTSSTDTGAETGPMSVDL